MRIIGIKEADKIHSYPLLFYIQDAKRALIPQTQKKAYNKSYFED